MWVDLRSSPSNFVFGIRISPGGLFRKLEGVVRSCRLERRPPRDSTACGIVAPRRRRDRLPGTVPAANLVAHRRCRSRAGRDDSPRRAATDRRPGAIRLSLPGALDAGSVVPDPLLLFRERGFRGFYPGLQLLWGRLGCAQVAFPQRKTATWASEMPSPTFASSISADAGRGLQCAGPRLGRPNPDPRKWCAPWRRRKGGSARFCGAPGRRTTRRGRCRRGRARRWCPRLSPRRTSGRWTGRRSTGPVARGRAGRAAGSRRCCCRTP